MIYLKFILGQIKLLGMIIISGLFVYPFIVYPKRKKLWEMKDLLYKKWYFWFADTYETSFGEYNYINSTYGVYELVQKADGSPDYDKFYTFSKLRKFVLSYRWGVIRNGCWNYIISQAPTQGEKENINEITNIGEGGYWTWRNKTFHGKQHVTWEQNGKQYFRYSFTKKFIFGLYINFMLGTGGSSNRNLIKLRIF